MFPSRVYLISKWGDVALGLSTGVFAYYWYEKKLGRTREDSLVGLVTWKAHQLRQQRDERKQRTNDDDAMSATNRDEWEQLTKELSSTAAK
ncbi:hypothetical protein JCM3766R1_001510 [Sporobolomyces carnicolor]